VKWAQYLLGLSAGEDRQLDLGFALEVAGDGQGCCEHGDELRVE